MWFFISNQKLKPEYRIEGGQAGKARRQRNHIVLALPAVVGLGWKDNSGGISHWRGSQIAFGNYVKFEGYVGMSDEKDPGGCGKGGTSTFEFLVDKKSLFKTKDPLAGSIDGKENTPPLKVEFDIPAGAKKLTIEIGDGGDGVGCDHSALGDTKLLTPQALTAEPEGKLPTVWGAVKSSY